MRFFSGLTKQLMVLIMKLQNKKCWWEGTALLGWWFLVCTLLAADIFFQSHVPCNFLATSNGIKEVVLNDRVTNFIVMAHVVGHLCLIHHLSESLWALISPVVKVSIYFSIIFNWFSFATKNFALKVKKVLKKFENCWTFRWKLFQTNFASFPRS